VRTGGRRDIVTINRSAAVMLLLAGHHFCLIAAVKLWSRRCFRVKRTYSFEASAADDTTAFKWLLSLRFGV
jgi:hypothetical protein